MAAIGYLARGLTRRQWRSWLAVALVIGIGGGIAMSSVAAARRTASAYPRFLDAANAPDLVVDDAMDVPEDFSEALGALPGVVDRSDSLALAIARFVDGVPDLGFPGEVLASVDGRRYYDNDRVYVVEGRMPDPDEPGEALVNRVLADKRGVAVGDRLDLRAATWEEVGAAFEGERIDGSPVSFAITGIGIFPEEVVVDDFAADSRMLVTTAFLGETDAAPLWTRSALWVADGTDLDDLRAGIRDLAGDGRDDVHFELRSDITERTQRALRPLLLALAGFAVVSAAAVALVSGQAAARAVHVGSQDIAAARPLGVRRSEMVASLLAGPVVSIAAGAALAIAIAVALSPFSPVGPVRAVEVNPGVSVDVTVLAAGVAVLVLAAVGRAAAAAVPAARVAGATASSRPSRTVTALATVGAPTSAVVGVGRALGRRSAGSRVTLTAAVLGCTALGAMAAFQGALDHLRRDPSIHGWAWDAAVFAEGGYGVIDPERVSEHADVAAITLAIYGSLTIDGIAVPAMGLNQVKGSALPVATTGRAATGTNEIALGTETLARLDRAVGDHIQVVVPGTDEPATMVVVGTTVFPGIGQIDVERATLSVGAYIVIGEDDGEQYSTAFVQFRPGANSAVALDALRRDFEADPNDVKVLPLVEPADIASLRAVGRAPLVLAGFLAATVLAVVAHSLVAASRLRRREQAVLAALGMRRRQLGSCSAWHAATMAVVGAVVGLPIGLAIGRQAWRSLATEIGIVTETGVPLLLTLLAAAILLLSASAMGTVLVRVGKPHRSAAVLRSE